MALYVTRPRRDEVRIGRGLPSGFTCRHVKKIDNGNVNTFEGCFSSSAEIFRMTHPSLNRELFESCQELIVKYRMQKNTLVVHVHVFGPNETADVNKKLSKKGLIYF